MLTNFALVGQSALVFHLWADRVYTTLAVMHEYQVGAVSGNLSPNAWGDLPTLTLTAEETELARTFSSRLGIGERSCIAVAKQRVGLFASDDADARAMAKLLDVPITGTLGILLLCVQRGIISLARGNVLLTTMLAAGYRSPVNVLDDLLVK